MICTPEKLNYVRANILGAMALVTLPTSIHHPYSNYNFEEPSEEQLQELEIKRITGNGDEEPTLEISGTKEMHLYRNSYATTVVITDIGVVEIEKDKLYEIVDIHVKANFDGQMIEAVLPEQALIKLLSTPGGINQALKNLATVQP